MKTHTARRYKAEKLTTRGMHSSPVHITKHRTDICIEDLNYLSQLQDEQEKRLSSPPNKAAITRPTSEPSKRILELYRFGTMKVRSDRMYAEESKIIHEAPIIVVKMVDIPVNLSAAPERRISWSPT